MMNKMILLICISVNILVANHLFKSDEEIYNYQPIKALIKDGKDVKVAYRIFNQKSSIFLLALNLNNYKTEIITLTNNIQFDNLENNSNYSKLLNKYTTNEGFQNSGIKYIENNTNHIYLTIDLCPSSKDGFEKDFFKKIVSLKKEKPIEIAIAISGKWILGDKKTKKKEHNKEFLWLLEQQRKNNIHITWVNHTYNHEYKYGLEPSKNFLLLPDTDINKEILDTEKLLLKYNQIPSVFLRFPGLVSNKDILTALRDIYLLFPLGSNSWLAKGDLIRSGSVILVHGNLNEPKGIKLVNSLLTDIKDGKSKYLLSPISDIFREQL